MKINQSIIEWILSDLPSGIHGCYTGQSILGFCPDPTFSWEEIAQWDSKTDVDIFLYNVPSLISAISGMMSEGWKPDQDIDEFKCDRIMHYDKRHKFKIQTVKLKNGDDFPRVNLTWKEGSEDQFNVIRAFDMDYLMVSYDLKNQTFLDLRGKKHRVANVNRYNPRFDPLDVEPSYWYRQFDRCPKGWSRGIDTRPVARQYRDWIKKTLEIGDRTLNSQTRHYADREMDDVIAPIIETGLSRDQAVALYHMARGERNTWEAASIRHRAALQKIEEWLKEVED